jgi:hypothetical protein
VFKVKISLIFDGKNLKCQIIIIFNRYFGWLRIFFKRF